MSHQNHKANQLIRIINSNWNKLTLFDIRDKSILALGYHSDQKYLEEARSQILLCKSEACIVTLLESVRNSKSDQIEELFLERIISNCSKQPLVCLISIKAFNYFDIETRKDIFFLLFEIFTSNLLDKDIRIEALNVLVDKYPNEMAENEDPNFKEKLIHYLNQSSLNGFSNSMRSSIKSYPSGILGYNLNQLMSDDGYLRNFDFSVSFKQNNSSRLDFLKVELYADNLSSFSAKLKQKKKDRKDPTSSLHLSIMGQKLKIVELFKGYASMISMLWALPTSPTSLFNSNFLVNDQIEYIFLSNGMSLRIENIGTLGIDIEGVTDVSLWNQYAKINLKTRASFINEQNLILINNFNILNTFQTSLKNQFLVDFDMNTDFNHDPYKLCIKMSQNKFHIKELSKVLDGEKKILQEINKILPIQGSGFMFSRETVNLKDLSIICEETL
ncbi:microsomal triglyceride transfer large subunit-like [Brachionus plicatilis]|uniref:Microsomal triglyceride transfer large subunit-like n=1 Tax=Brachionus plicatilis TaxID=10195 RepID=A0A3M7R5Z9_BRAPC|nr:microsomal triglyceride transfer large subunit-like [Brachionus plicatilis]